MKFSKKFDFDMVPEWKTKYLDYRKLKKQITKIKTEALAIAKALTTVQETTAQTIIADKKIDVRDLKDEAIFWELLNANLKTVEDFYIMQINNWIDQFHSLVSQLVYKRLLQDYVPKKKGQKSRLEREISRQYNGIEVKHQDNEYEENVKFLKMIKRITPNSPTDYDDSVIWIDDTGLADLKTSNSLISYLKQVTKKQLKHAFGEFYRGLILLQNYATSNAQATEKILKKHDKNIGLKTKDSFMKQTLIKFDFYKHSELNTLISEVEIVYATAFENGHRTKAMEKLRVPLETGLTVEVANFRLGVYLGFTVMLLLLILYIGLNYSTNTFPRFQSMIIVYRMMGMAVLLVWFWGLDMYIWTKYHVNYVFIFEFNPRRHFRYQHMLEAACLFTFLWCLSLTLYMLEGAKPPGFAWLSVLPWQIHPIILLTIFLLFSVFFQLRSNFWLATTLSRILIPLKKIAFRDFFLADQLSSIVIVLYDLQYSICFFVLDAWDPNSNLCLEYNKISRPLIAMLPAFWRIMQCIRKYYDSRDFWQAINGMKYFCSVLVSVFSLLRGLYGSFYFYLWLILIVTSTAFTFLWDIKRDWGIGVKQYSYLRKEMLYPVKYYYIAIVTNLILRMAWALTISPESIGIVMDPVLFTSVLAVIEIARRAQWNVFRLENEQLNNLEKYRAIEVTVPLMVIEKKKQSNLAKNVIEPVRDFVEEEEVVNISIDVPALTNRNRKTVWNV